MPERESPKHNKSCDTLVLWFYYCWIVLLWLFQYQISWWKAVLGITFLVSSHYVFTDHWYFYVCTKTQRLNLWNLFPIWYRKIRVLFLTFRWMDAQPFICHRQHWNKSERKGPTRRAVINNWQFWWGHKEKCSVCRINLSFCICNAWFNFPARAGKMWLNVIYFWGFWFHVNYEKNTNHFRLSETTFLLPSKPNIILPNSSNHVSGLKGNPKKLKECSKLPQLPVAAGEEKDHRQEAVLPTCYSRGILIRVKT